MFRGLNAISMDEKGRMAIPVRFRDIINNQSDGILIITIDTEDRCLLIYLQPQWEKIENKLESLSSFHPVTRRIQRLLIGHATDVEMDRSGRILLPPLLREYAGLDKNIMLVGQSNKFEIWGETQWLLARDGWISQGLEESEDVPAELKNLSL